MPGTVIHVLCRRSALLPVIAPIKRSVNTRAHVQALFQGTKIKQPVSIISTLELRPVPGTVIHVLCRRSAPLVAIAAIKRSVNTKAHVRAPFQGTKIKRGTGTSNSDFQKNRPFSNCFEPHYESEAKVLHLATLSY